MFANTPKGAEASMMLYSLIITAKANNLEPHEWLKATLDRIPFVKTADELEQLLPLTQNRNH